jgi:heat shock protein HslJ
VKIAGFISHVRRLLTLSSSVNSWVVQVTEEPTNVRRPGKRLTSPERWEVVQLIKSGVLDVTEYPTFDEEGQVHIHARCHL